MVFGPASQLGVGLFEDTEPFELVPGRSEEEVESIIRAVYRQVLGNAYVMESERVAIPESQFKLGELSVREFVRAVGKSDLYRSRFFDSCPRYRATELNFKQPDDALGTRREVAAHHLGSRLFGEHPPQGHHAEAGASAFQGIAPAQSFARRHLSARFLSPQRRKLRNT